MTRGQIDHIARALQLRDFSNLRYGNITPTDVDALIEFHDRAYVLIEVKSEGAPISHGQTQALERLCDDLQRVKPTLLIFGRHDTPPDTPIDFGACRVERYRWQGQNYEAHYSDVKKLTDKFLERAA